MPSKDFHEHNAGQEQQLSSVDSYITTGIVLSYRDATKYHVGYRFIYSNMEAHGSDYGSALHSREFSDYVRK